MISYDGRNAEVCLESVGNTVGLKYNGAVDFFDYGECRTIDEQKVCLRNVVCDSCELITYEDDCYDYGDYLYVDSGDSFSTQDNNIRVGEVDECADNSKCVYPKAVTVYVSAKNQGQTTEEKIVYIPLGITQEIEDGVGLLFKSYDGTIKFQIIGTEQSCVVPACPPDHKLYNIGKDGDCNLYECRNPCADAYISIDGYGLSIEQYSCTMYYTDDYTAELCWHEMVGDKLGLKVNGEIGFFEEGECRTMDGKKICLKDLDGCDTPDKCELITYDGDCFDFHDYMKVDTSKSFKTPHNTVTIGQVDDDSVVLYLSADCPPGMGCAAVLQTVEIDLGEIKTIETGLALQYIAGDSGSVKFKIREPTITTCDVIDYNGRCYDYGDHFKFDTDDEFNTPNYKVTVNGWSSGGCAQPANADDSLLCKVSTSVTLNLFKCTASGSCTNKHITIEQGETEVIDEHIALEFISTDFDYVKFEIHKDKDVDCSVVEFENKCYTYGDYFKPEVKDTFKIPGEIVTVSSIDDDNEYVRLSIEADCDIGEYCTEYIRSLKIAKGSSVEIADDLALELVALDEDRVKFRIEGIDNGCPIPICKDGSQPTKVGYKNDCPVYECPKTCDMIEYQGVCLDYGHILKIEKKDKFYTTEEQFSLTTVDDEVELFVLARCDGPVCPTYFRHITFDQGQTQDLTNDIALKLLSVSGNWANFKIMHPEDDDLPDGITPVEPTCDGCVVRDRCVSYGIRMRNGDSKYCDISGSLLEQKKLGETCENNYECVSNSCSNGKCIDLSKDIEESNSLLKKIFDWLSRIFG